MESELKSSCEQLIALHTQQLIGPLLAMFNRVTLQQAEGKMPEPKAFRAGKGATTQTEWGRHKAWEQDICFEHRWFCE